MLDSDSLSPPQGTLLVSPDPDTLALGVGTALVETIIARVNESGCCRVALSGGSTPQRLYRWLATQDLPWKQIQWFWGDERNVPLDHPESNYRMVREAMLDPGGVPESTIFPVPIDVLQPEIAARKYEETLRERFSTDLTDEGLPIFDLILLGMGDDAHTASLFPETTALQISDRVYLANWVPKFSSFRLTLSAAAINAAREVWFIIAGAGKREAIRHVWGQEISPEKYPSQLVHPTKGGLRWWLSQEALPRESDKAS